MPGLSRWSLFPNSLGTLNSLCNFYISLFHKQSKIRSIMEIHITLIGLIEIFKIFLFVCQTFIVFMLQLFKVPFSSPISILALCLQCLSCSYGTLDSSSNSDSWRQKLRMNSTTRHDRAMRYKCFLIKLSRLYL